MLSFFIYALLTAQAIASTHYVSNNPQTDFKCTDGPNNTCNIYCDQPTQYNTHSQISFDCGNAKECYFYCERIKCAENTHIIATNSTNLHIIVGANGEECMNGAIIHTPNHGNAIFDMGNSKKGFAGMTVYAGTNAQNIIINAESTNIAGDDCKGMQIFAATAEYVEISLGKGIKWENGILQCPVITGRYNDGDDAPCILYAPNAILMNTHIFANDGIPENIWISPAVIYMGMNVLTCNGSSGETVTSVAPFDMNSECWFTLYPITTYYPSHTHSNNLTVIVADTTISDTDSTNTISIAYSSDEDFFTSLLQHVSVTSSIMAVLVLLVCCCGCLLCYYVRRKRQLHAQLFAKKRFGTGPNAHKNDKISPLKNMNINVKQVASKSYPSPISVVSPISPSVPSGNSHSGFDAYFSSPSHQGEVSLSVPNKPILNNVASVGSYHTQRNTRNLSEWQKHQYHHAQLMHMHRSNSMQFQKARAIQQFYANYANSQSLVHANSRSLIKPQLINANSQSLHVIKPQSPPYLANNAAGAPFVYPLQFPPPPPASPSTHNDIPPPPPLIPPPPPLHLSALSDASYTGKTGDSDSEKTQFQNEKDENEIENIINESVSLEEEKATELDEHVEAKWKELIEADEDGYEDVYEDLEVEITQMDEELIDANDEVYEDEEYEYEDMYEEVYGDNDEKEEKPKIADGGSGAFITGGKLKYFPDESTQMFPIKNIDMEQNEGDNYTYDLENESNVNVLERE